MFKKILKCCLFCCLFVFANANESLVNEILDGGRGFGCNEEKTECWNVDWLGEERFFLSPVGIKVIGRDALRKDACNRAIKHYLSDDHESFAAKNILIDSVERENNEFKHIFREFEFKVYSHKKERDKGKEPEEITTCEFKKLGDMKLINLLEKKSFACSLQDASNILMCEKDIKNTNISFYLRNTDVNVVVEQTLDVDEEYNANEIFESQKQYCHHAFDQVLGDESKRAKNLLDFNIKEEKGNGVIYTAMIYAADTKKSISVFAIDEKTKDHITVGMVCFINPLMALYLQ